MKELMMNLTLWIVAGLLAAVFLLAGTIKLIVPKEKLAAISGGGWVEDFSAGFVKALGAVEILAAVGLGLVMIGAAIVEFRRQEFKHMLLNLTYLSLIAFVAWGRFGPESFI